MPSEMSCHSVPLPHEDDDDEDGDAHDGDDADDDRRPPFLPFKTIQKTTKNQFPNFIIDLWNRC